MKQQEYLERIYFPRRDGVIVRIVEVSKMRYSVNGNPRWLLVAEGDVFYRTAPDSQVGYELGYNWEGRLVRIWTDIDGQVTGIREVTP